MGRVKEQQEEMNEKFEEVYNQFLVKKLSRTAYDHYLYCIEPKIWNPSRRVIGCNCSLKTKIIFTDTVIIFNDKAPKL